MSSGSLPTSITELCAYALQLPSQLLEIVSKYRPLVAAGKDAHGAKSAAYDRTMEVEGRLLAAAQVVVAVYARHPKLNPVRQDIRAVRKCVAKLCRLTNDRVQFPHDEDVSKSWVAALQELHQAVGVLGELALLAPPQAHDRGATNRCMEDNASVQGAVGDPRPLAGLQLPGAGASNPFDELLTAFRNGYAKYGAGGFELHLATSKEANGFFASPACGYVGSIFFREPNGPRAPNCYLIFGSFRSENWEPSDDAIREFSSLARRAGGHLPLAVREQFSVRQNDPAGWWLAYMWLHSPPVENKLQQRKSWPEPFLAAAEAIERGGLCTPRRPTDMGGSSADARVGGEPAIRAARQEPGLDGCVPADTLALEDGIARNRLSEAARDGKVRSMPAPRGMKDSQGKAVHRLYHRGDALEYCSPKRVTKRTRRRLGFRN